MTTYKALSMWQPWASFVVKGLKGVETRSRRLNYRGVVLIHAAKHWTRAEREVLQRIRADHGAVCARMSNDTPPLGAIVGAAFVSECREMDDEWVQNTRAWNRMEYDMGAWLRGRYGLVFAGRVELLQPIQLKGNQGYPFNVPADALGEREVEVARLARELAELHS